MPVGARTLGARLVDLDADGNLDLALAQENFVRVLRGLGDGTFSETHALPLAGWHGTLAAADLDGNGTVDLLTASSPPHRVHLILADAHGAFSSASVKSIAVPQAVRSAVIGDWNGDGVRDLAFLRSTGPLLEIWRASSALEYAVSTLPLTDLPQGLIPGDWNGDTRLDLAAWTVSAATSMGTLRTFLGLGDGSFQALPDIPSGHGSVASVAVDFDGDGCTDVAAVHEWSNAVTVAYGSASSPFSKGVRLGALLWSMGIDAADLDGDGGADLVTGSSLEWALAVLASDGAGGFRAPGGPGAGGTSLGCTAADLDGDGRADLVSIAGDAPNVVRLLRNAGDGAFDFIDIAAEEYPWSCAAADLDGDARPEVVVSGYSEWLGVIRRLDDGTYDLTTHVPPGTGAFGRIALGDVNLDGAMDVVTNRFGESRVRFNDGVGGLVAGPPIPDFDMSENVALGDFSGDGLLDLARAPGLVFSWSFYFQVLRGDGSGAFVPTQWLENPVPVSNLCVADVDGDGLEDLVTGGTIAGTSKLHVFRAVGAAAFAPPVSYDLQGLAGINRIVPGDLNGDGLVDILAATWDTSSVELFLGNGAGGLAPQSPARVGGLLADAVLADVDADGHTDAVLANSFLEQCTILWNQGPQAAGVTDFGTGTPGCLGTLGAATTGTPALGASQFAIVSTNAARNAAGAVLLADASDPGGSDPFGIGLTLYVDLLSASEIGSIPISSDSAGVSAARLPIPNDLALYGKSFVAQTIWIAPGCAPFPYPLVSSRGLSITIGG